MGNQPLLREWVRYHRGRLADLKRGTLVGAATEFVTSIGRDAAKVVKWRLMGLRAGETLLTADRFELLDAAALAARPDGLWLEFGVSGGASIHRIAARTPHGIVGFDSFEGLPRAWHPQFPAGSFSTGGVPPAVPANVTLIKGWFDRTLPGFLEEHPGEPVAFLHVDCDLYTSARFVLGELGSRIGPGTVIVFDEFCGWLPDDEARAWREFSEAHGVTARWLGSSWNGAVALVVVRLSRRALPKGVPVGVPAPA